MKKAIAIALDAIVMMLWAAEMVITMCLAIDVPNLMFEYDPYIVVLCIVFVLGIDAYVTSLVFGKLD